MCCKRARPHKGRPTSLIRDIRDRASGGNQTYEASHPSRARPSEPNSTPPTGPAGLLMQPETASAINTGGPLHEPLSVVPRDPHGHDYHRIGGSRRNLAGRLQPVSTCHVTCEEGPSPGPILDPSKLAGEEFRLLGSELLVGQKTFGLHLSEFSDLGHPILRGGRGRSGRLLCLNLCGRLVGSLVDHCLLLCCCRLLLCGGRFSLLCGVLRGLLVHASADSRGRAGNHCRAGHGSPESWAYHTSSRYFSILFRVQSRDGSQHVLTGNPLESRDATMGTANRGAETGCPTVFPYDHHRRGVGLQTARELGQVLVAQQVELCVVDSFELVGDVRVTDFDGRGGAVGFLAHEGQIDDAYRPAVMQLRERRCHVAGEVVSLEDDQGDVDRTDRFRIQACGHVVQPPSTR